MQWRLIATACFVLSAITDLLDGIAARKMNATTEIGIFLDPLADKFLVLSGFIVLLLRPDLIWGNWNLWILISVILIAFREIAVTVLRSWRVAKASPIVTSVWGKSKTTVQMITLITAFILFNARDFFDWDSVFLRDAVAIGILLSALLALFSGANYFYAVFGGEAKPVDEDVV